VGLAALGGVALLPRRSLAEEPLWLDVEADVAAPLSEPQKTWFGPGGSASLGVHQSLATWFALSARLRTLGLLDGDTPAQPGTKNPGLGTLNSLALGGTVRLPKGDGRRATGAFAEALLGGGLTGKTLRASMELGLGYGFALSDTFSLAPVARYVQVFQPDDGLSGKDAKLVLVGARLAMFDANTPARPPETIPSAAPDRDADGIPDASDACPDAPEDKDGFQDEDGCPEEDNDADGIVDVKDGCPNIAEDMDGFQDDDGCPEDDNDGDGIRDGLDKCPLEPETLNGEDDADGCPDAGLIVMHDDRIVLDERVLFDTDRAHVTRGGEPVLAAIVRLCKQHPDWRKVRVEGHADVRGHAQLNQVLSERRAITVREALIRHGLDPSMITAEGFGATRPLADGTSDSDHRTNRRVEFVVIARDGSIVPGAIPSTGSEKRELTP
jgi:outer membrane protein OmpA-like peptidoglycan-associated protein